MITLKLTGKTRYRVETRWFKDPLIVLQVEEHKFGYFLDHHLSTCDIDITYYRDAQLEDLRFRNDAAAA